MLDLAHLTVDDLGVTDHPATKGLTDGLMPETHAKQRNPRLGSGESERQADSRLIGIAGTG